MSEMEKLAARMLQKKTEETAKSEALKSKRYQGEGMGRIAGSAIR